jgi:predicted esterase
MSTRSWLPLLIALVVGVAGCESAAGKARPAATNSDDVPSSKSTHRTSVAPSRDPAREWNSGAIRVEPLDDTAPAVFVVKGRGIGPAKFVFLHGMCGHGLGYAQSFQHASARKGRLIAPQADVVCGEGPWAKWSKDIAALDTRITAAFRKLGYPEPIGDICVLGMSQGATRAAALARTFPERYTRLVSMGAPTQVDTTGLDGLRAAVLLVGERERKDLMRASEKALQKKGVPSTSMIIPDADHAGMGPTPEETMGEVLDWLWENSKAAR